MPYSSPSMLIRYRGYLLATNQSWSIGFRIPTPSLATQVELDAISASLAGTHRMQAAVVATATLGGGSAWTGVDCYSYASLPGSANGQSSADFSPVCPGSGDNLPTQCALVVSLRTASPGARNRGRVYLPMTKVTALESSGQVGATALASIADDVKALVDAVNTTVEGAGLSNNVSVISATHNAVSVVTRLLIDSKLDTQRRREDKIPAAYSQTRVPA